MAATVREIMNREVLSVRPEDGTAQAREALLAMGVSGAPVVDAARTPIGVVSLSDLAAVTEERLVADAMTAPAEVVPVGAPAVQAARLMAQTGRRRLVVVDDQGRLVGMVSALDALRALLGQPVRHPPTFPHFDPATGVNWTDDHRLEMEEVDAAPEGPGVLVLVQGAAGVPERVVWAEATVNLKAKLLDLLSLPQDTEVLRRLLDDRAHLRFRAAVVEDAAARLQVRDRMKAAARERPAVPTNES